MKLPFLTLLQLYRKELLFGTFAAVTTFVVFYLMTVFMLNWNTKELHFSNKEALLMQLFSVLFFAGFIPVSAVIADKIGRRKMLLYAFDSYCYFRIVLFVFSEFRKHDFGYFLFVFGNGIDGIYLWSNGNLSF